MAFQMVTTYVGYKGSYLVFTAKLFTGVTQPLDEYSKYIVTLSFGYSLLISSFKRTLFIASSFNVLKALAYTRHSPKWSPHPMSFPPPRWFCQLPRSLQTWPKENHF